jgi:hypothetical protein
MCGESSDQAAAATALSAILLLSDFGYKPCSCSLILAAST